MNKILEFLRHEIADGLLLLAAAALDNSPLARFNDALLATALEVRIGAVGLAKPLLLWINDGLMAVFFLLVGLSIKRKVREGHLASWRQAALPVVASVGGMVVPTLIYVSRSIPTLQPRSVDGQLQRRPTSHFRSAFSPCWPVACRSR